MSKCTWCQSDILSEAYHDEEWGIPLHDDRKHFEYLLMEVMQCGLSWNLMLKKRETFRMCFDDFDYDKIAAYDEQKDQVHHADREYDQVGTKDSRNYQQRDTV